MTKTWIHLTPLLLLLASTPAWAMDCAKATSKLDKQICADPKLKAADAAMSTAYFKLLGSIKDEEIRASLLASQRRWIKARDEGLGDLAHLHGGSGEDPLDESQQRAILLAATRERTEALTARSGEQPNFVAVALKQRRLASAYSGGPLAGYRGECSFIPGRTDATRWGYNCVGTRTYQQGDRVCSEDVDFASYTAVITRSLSVVQNDKRKLIASCEAGISCPGDASAGSSHKEAKSQAFSPIPADEKHLPHIDPDLPYEDDDDRGWMRACLMEPSFSMDKPST